MMPSPPYTSVMSGTSAQAIAAIFHVLFPDASTAWDMTYGRGMFWKGPDIPQLRVYGSDRSIDRAPHVVADFQRLPVQSHTVDVAVFDPPFLTDVGKASAMGGMYGSARSINDLEDIVRRGTQEAWRISKLGIVVKVQDYIHASRAVWMSDWVRQAIPDPQSSSIRGLAPYDVVHLVKPNKIRSPKWGAQLSMYRNHATFWIFRRDPIHRRRVSRGIAPS